MDAKPTGQVLHKDQRFVAVQAVRGQEPDRRLWLKLHNGGWVFEDSVYHPETPSVRLAPNAYHPSMVYEVTVGGINVRSAPDYKSEVVSGQTLKFGERFTAVQAVEGEGDDTRVY